MPRTYIAILIIMSFMGSTLSAASAYQDYLQQAPELKRPEAGYIAGSLSKFAPSAAGASKGFQNLALDLSFDQQRGPLLAQIQPSYSPTHGIGPFGFGFDQNLAIQRFRLSGSIRFDETDEWSSPWGPLKPGTDGYFYPQGLGEKVRIKMQDDRVTAFVENREIFYFEQKDTTAAGVFSYFLSRVVDSSGHTTLLSYEKTAGATWLLRQVKYGGRQSEELPYTIDFLSESVGSVPASMSYQSGERRSLDRRFQELRFSAKGIYRYSYRFFYENVEFGPGFFLTGLQKQYASGEVDPAESLSYLKTGPNFGKIEAYKGLDRLVDRYGRAFYQGDTVSFYDWNEDGREDIEVAADRQVYLQTGDGFIAGQKYTDNGSICFPKASAKNLARKVLPIFGYKKGLNVITTARETGATYRITSCNLDGEVQDTISLPLNLEMDSFLRWVDLNHDGRVDLVRLLGNSLRIFENQSADGKLLFKELGAFALPLTTQPKAIWFGDLNGDGLTDFLLSGGSALNVYYGIADFQFDSQPAKYPVYRTNGSPFLLNDYGLDLLDLNGDGLSDLSLTKGKERVLFRNSGREFIQTSLPIRSGIINESESFSLNLGENSTPYMLRLDGAGSAIGMPIGSRFSSFLESWNDGRGTLLSFEYAAQAGAVGQEIAYPYVKGIVKRSVGMGERRTDFVVEQPVLHSRVPMLLGFAKLTMIDKLTKNISTFLHEDDFAGIEQTHASEDLKISGLQTIIVKHYSTDQYQGIPWPRLDSIDKTQKREAGSMVELQKFRTYDSNLCPRAEENVYQQETLIKDINYWPSEDLFMSCLPTRVRIKGQHARMDLNFEHAVEISREANGDPKLIEMVNPKDSTKRMLVQEIKRDNLGRPEALTSLDLTKKTFAYDGNSDLLQSVTTGYGFKEAITARDPYDQIKAYSVYQNPQSPWLYFFKRDGRERLRGTWDRGFGSEEQPLMSIAYQDASMQKPGALLFSQFHVNSQSSHLWSDIYTAAGKKVAQIETFGNGFVVKDATRIFDAEKIEEHYPLQRASVSDYELLDLHQPETRIEGSGSQEQFQGMKQVDADSTRKQQFDYLVNGFLQKIETTNGKYTKRWESNSRGDVVAYTDEESFKTNYSYDALGRLRSLTLPDGKKHSIEVDEFGRTKRIFRTEVGSVEYEYAEGSLVSDKRYFDTKGVLDRSTHHEYDEHGRRVLDVFTKGSEIDTIRYFHDGRTFDGQVIVGQIGKLTQVQGSDYLKTWIFDEKGRLVSSEQTAVTSHGSVVRNEALSYDEADRPTNSKLSLKDGSKSITYETAIVYDSSGRQQKLLLNGMDLFSYGYNSLGLNDSISSEGSKLSMDFDSFTQAPKGFWFQDFSFGKSPVSYRLDLDDRGLTSSEIYEANGASSVRSYLYTPRGFLQKTSIGGVAYLYDYDDNGIMKSLTDRNGTRSFRHDPAQTQDIGGQKLVIDAMSRISEIGGRTFKFGARGVVTSSKSTEDSSEFILDEAGRVFITKGGVDEIHFGEDLYRNGTFLQPIKQGSQLLGWLENGIFKAAVSDFRGTPLSTGDAALFLDPFGAGESQGPYSASLHFAGHGLDKASGLVLMGVRQYDSSLGIFLSPDPLFLEQPAECLKSPTECGLFSYAGNSPLNNVDPDGKKLKDLEKFKFMNAQAKGAMKMLNETLVEMGYRDADFTIRITGGDRYIDDEGKIRSSSDNKIIASSAKNSNHLEKNGGLAIDFKFEGVTRKDLETAMEKVGFPKERHFKEYPDAPHEHTEVDPKKNYTNGLIGAFYEVTIALSDLFTADNNGKQAQKGLKK